MKWNPYSSLAWSSYGDPSETGYEPPRYCECEFCGGLGWAYTLRSIINGVVRAVDRDTFWEAPNNEEECKECGAEWFQWDTSADCPECDGSGRIDTHPDNSSHDIYCKGDDKYGPF